MTQIEETTPDKFKQDPHNANKGTKRGMSALQTSVSERGIGRPIVVAVDGTIIEGNKTQLAALEAGIKEALVVHTTGKKLIVHQRDDLEAGSEEAKRLALEDNRIGELNLAWDMSRVQEVWDSFPSAKALWSDESLAQAFTAADYPDSDPEYDDTQPAMQQTQARPSLAREEKTYHLQFDIAFDDSIIVQRALKEWEMSGRDRGSFLVQLSEIYLNGL